MPSGRPFASNESIGPFDVAADAAPLDDDGAEAAEDVDDCPDASEAISARRSACVAVLACAAGGVVRSGAFAFAAAVRGVQVAVATVLADEHVRDLVDSRAAATLRVRRRDAMAVGREKVEVRFACAVIG